MTEKENIKVGMGFIDAVLTNKALDDLTKTPLAPVLQFQLTRFLHKITEEHRAFTEVRQGIIQKYGKKDDSGELQVIDDKVTFEGDDMTAANAALGELVTQAVDIGMPKIDAKLADLPALTTSDMELLMIVADLS